MAKQPKLIPKVTRDKIMGQVRKELDHARDYKSQKMLASWQLNDDLVFGKKKKLEETRSNINIASTKAKGFVNTLLSKVDSAPNIKFSPGEDSDLKKSNRANALLLKDAAPANGNWAFKDLMGKKSSIKYGRTIFEYHASSIGGYKSFLTLVNVHDFYIDPMAGGMDIERAKYLGRAGINKSKKQLKEGRKNGIYIKDTVKELLANGSVQEETEEEKRKANRYYVMKSTTKRLLVEDEWSFIEWGTTYEGERYYVLFNEQTGLPIKLTLWKDKFESGLWSYCTYATDPDEEEFWTPASLDGVRELFMGQHVLVNQQIDNNEQINQPMKGYDTGAIKNAKMLRWRRNGNIPFKKGTNMERAFKVFAPAPLTTNIQTYNLLDGIAQVESGITNDTKGLSEQDVLGIYEGNLQASADRLGLQNKSYSDCYNRLGLLYYNGLKEHLNMKVAIKMIGSKGAEYEEITKADVLPKGKEFDIIVSSSDINLNSDTTESKNKLDFLALYKENERYNQDAIFETEGLLVGFEPEEIRRFQDIDNFGNAEVMSQAASDFQEMQTGSTDVEPYSGANTAYKQVMVNKLIELGNVIKPEIQTVIINYIDSLEDIIIRNTVRTAKKQIAAENLQATEGLVQPEATPAAVT